MKGSKDEVQIGSGDYAKLKEDDKADPGPDLIPLSNIEKIHPAQYYRYFLEKGLRADGRKITEFRPVDVRNGILSTCQGSSIVRLGRTTVLCGIKAELTHPNTPDEGYFVINLDLPALCSGMFKPGPPSELSMVTCQYITDVIHSSNIVDLKALCICEKKLCWVLYADISFLNYEGNPVDSAIISLMAALRDVKLPGVTYDECTNTPIVNMNEKITLEFKNGFLIPATLGAFNSKYIVADPISEEDSMCATLSVITNGNDLLRGIIKHDGASIRQDLLAECIEIAKGHTKRMFTELKWMS